MTEIGLHTILIQSMSIPKSVLSLIRAPTDMVAMCGASRVTLCAFRWRIWGAEILEGNSFAGPDLFASLKDLVDDGFKLGEDDDLSVPGERWVVREALPVATTRQ